MLRLLLVLAVAGTVFGPAPAASARPDNDDRAAAAVVPELPFAHMTSTEDATEEVGEILHCSQAASTYLATVWYSFTAPFDGPLVVDTAGSDFDTVVALYEHGALLPSHCNDQHAGSRDQALLRFEAVAGRRYEVQVGGYLGRRGALHVYVGSPPPAPELVPGGADDRPVTVVAVVDDAFSPYHFNFLGSRHPWNTDADETNDFDFTTDPADYIEGHPGATPIPVTLPTSADERIDGYHAGQDAAAWQAFRPSNGHDPNLYWFPGTKIVGAVSFDGSADPVFFGRNSSHGTRSATSAAGNILGTCDACLFVLIQGFTSDALAWAASQPWIDVITNSYGHSTTLVVRDNIYLGAPLDATQEASEDGSVIAFSAGNGLANSFDVPALTYWSSEKGPDWIVTVGAVSPSSRQTYSGSGKPVDVSSIGSTYPSTGGVTADGRGTHSGTSNAAPVVAGYFGKVLQEARELLGDLTAGHSGGVVASGDPVACGAAVTECALSDGVLTRIELEDLVLGGALPSPMQLTAGTVWPSTEYAYYYQGHGVLAGVLDGREAFETEVARILDVAQGHAAPHERPAGEQEWFVIDSKCRQRFWGSWNGGAYTGAEPSLDPAADPIATAFDAWCTPLPEGFART